MKKKPHNNTQNVAFVWKAFPSIRTCRGRPCRRVACMFITGTASVSGCFDTVNVPTVAKSCCPLINAVENAKRHDGPICMPWRRNGHDDSKKRIFVKSTVLWRLYANVVTATMATAKKSRKTVWLRAIVLPVALSQRLRVSQVRETIAQTCH